MNILEQLKPTKQAKEFKITAYEEDVTLFKNAVKKLNKKFKGSGEITEESLFEHLISPLRAEEELSKGSTRTTAKKRKEPNKALGNEKKVNGYAQ